MPATNRNEWFPPISDSQGRTRVFCLPYAGGGASIFRDWPSHAQNFQPVPLRLPGREMRIKEPCIDRLDEMVDTLIDVLKGHTSSSYAFFGHSMGALIAFELTLRILDEGIPPPVLLAVSARQAPHLDNPDSWESIRNVSDERFVEILNGISNKTGEILADSSLYSLMLPLLRADFSLCEDYRPRTPNPIPVPVLAFSGAHDPSVAVEQVRQWKQHTARDFDMEVFDAEHLFVHSHASFICKALDQSLAFRYDAARNMSNG